MNAFDEAHLAADKIARVRAINKGVTSDPKFVVPAEAVEKAAALQREAEREGVKYVRDDQGVPVRVVFRYEDAADAVSGGDGDESE